MSSLEAVQCRACGLGEEFDVDEPCPRCRTVRSDGEDLRRRYARDPHEVNHLVSVAIGEEYCDVAVVREVAGHPGLYHVAGLPERTQADLLTPADQFAESGDVVFMPLQGSVSVLRWGDGLLELLGRA